MLITECSILGAGGQRFVVGAVIRLANLFNQLSEIIMR